MQQAVERGHRAHIGKEAQFLTHGQQTRLRTNLGRRVIIELERTYSGKEHSIGLHTHLVGTVGVRITYLVDGMGTTDGTLVFELMSALGSNGIEHSHTLFHNLWANTVALKNRNLQFHNSFVFSFS